MVTKERKKQFDNVTFFLDERGRVMDFEFPATKRPSDMEIKLKELAERYPSISHLYTGKKSFNG